MNDNQLAPVARLRSPPELLDTVPRFAAAAVESRLGNGWSPRQSFLAVQERLPFFADPGVLQRASVALVVQTAVVNFVANGCTTRTDVGYTAQALSWCPRI